MRYLRCQVIFFIPVRVRLHAVWYLKSESSIAIFQTQTHYANYMDVDFIGTTDIVAGYNHNLNKYNGLFITTILCQERPKYSFGIKWKTRLRETVIKLPQDANGNPDWVYMEQYAQSLSSKEITTTNSNKTVILLYCVPS